MSAEDHQAARAGGAASGAVGFDANGFGAAVMGAGPREAALAERRTTLASACAGVFAAVLDAPPETAPALRAKLAGLHEELSETVRRRANLAWEFDSVEGLAEDSNRLLTELALVSGGSVGLAGLAKARAALARGDFDPAGQAFADIAAHGTLAAAAAGRLAFAQGLIAEQAGRPDVAASHFATSARLDPHLRSLRKARALACRTGDLTAAFRFGQALIVLAETSGRPEDRAMAMAEHAQTLDAQDRPVEAEGFLRKAVLGARSAAGRAGEDQARYLALLARVLEAQEKLPAAEAALRKALDVTRTTVGEGHPDYPARLNALAGILQAQDRDTEAEQVQRKALDLARHLAGGAHPVTVDCLTGLAQLCEKLRRLTPAETLYRSALELDLMTIGPTHPDHAGRLCALAEVLRAQRRLPEAEALFRRALDIDRATISEAHRDYGVALNNLAGVVEAQGCVEEAEQIYATALAIFRSTLGDLHPATQKVTRNFRALISVHLPASVHRPGVEALWALAKAEPPGLGGQS